MLTFLSGRNYAAPLLISRPEHGSESENGEYEEDEERARAMEGFEAGYMSRDRAYNGDVSDTDDEQLGRPGARLRRGR